MQRWRRHPDVSRWLRKLASILTCAQRATVWLPGREKSTFQPAPECWSQTCEWAHWNPRVENLCQPHRHPQQYGDSRHWRCHWNKDKTSLFRREARQPIQCSRPIPVTKCCRKQISRHTYYRINILKSRWWHTYKYVPTKFQHILLPQPCGNSKKPPKPQSKAVSLT